MGGVAVSGLSHHGGAAMIRARVMDSEGCTVLCVTAGLLPVLAGPTISWLHKDANKVLRENYFLQSPVF